jgi:hypothetical protein
MLKIFTVSLFVLVSVGVGLGAMSSAPEDVPAATAAVLPSSQPAQIEVPDSLRLFATATRCYCGDGWSFAMSPCNQTQCANLCVHGHQTGGFCR